MGGKARVHQPDSEFNNYIQNTATILESGTPTGAVRLGLNSTDAASWLDYRDQWIDIYPKYTNKGIRTTAIKNSKNTIKKNFTKFATNPLKQIEISPNLTDEDRLAFNLTERDDTPTQRGFITTAPFGKVKGTGGGILEVRTRREVDATRSSMHPLADGVEFRYILVNINPPNPGPNPNPIPTPNPDEILPEDLPNSVISKKSFWRINLGSQNQGKKIIGYSRWVNLSNPEKNSGWSEVMKTIIS